MKKAFLITGIILSFSFSQVKAQTVFIPDSTRGIGVTTNPSTGNVGVGTNTPAASLEIAGFDDSPGAVNKSATLRLNSLSGISTATSFEMGYHNSTSTFNKVFSINYSSYPSCGSGAVKLGGSVQNSQITFYNSRIGIGSSPVSCSGSGKYGDIVMGFTGIKELLVGNGYSSNPFNRIETLQSGYKLGVNGNAYITGTLAIGARVSTFTQGFPTGYSLFVSDGILTEKLKVAVKTTANWADHVFAKEYQLKSLEDVETYINENKHLPDVPSAEEVVKSGINVAEMDALLLQKIEELTLYVIQLKAELNTLKKQ